MSQIPRPTDWFSTNTRIYIYFIRFAYFSFPNTFNSSGIIRSKWEECFLFALNLSLLVRYSLVYVFSFFLISSLTLFAVASFLIWLYFILLSLRLLIVLNIFVLRVWLYIKNWSFHCNTIYSIAYYRRNFCVSIFTYTRKRDKHTQNIRVFATHNTQQQATNGTESQQTSKGKRKKHTKLCIHSICIYAYVYYNKNDWKMCTKTKKKKKQQRKKPFSHTSKPPFKAQAYTSLAVTHTCVTLNHRPSIRICTETDAHSHRRGARARAINMMMMAFFDGVEWFRLNILYNNNKNL